MNTPTPPLIRRRRIWPWVLGAVIIAPVVMVAAVAYSFVGLDSETATLRRHLMQVTGAEWDTRVQLSLGRVSFATLRGALSFSTQDEIAEARLALKGIKRASVGVYELRGAAKAWSQAELMHAADAVMQRHGWDRIVGVMDDGDTVMIYMPAKTGEPREVCVAVVSKRELVVVSAGLNPEALVQLAKRHRTRSSHAMFAALGR